MKLNSNVLAFFFISGASAFQAPLAANRQHSQLNAFAYDPKSGTSRATGPAGERPGDSSPSSITRDAMNRGNNNSYNTNTNTNNNYATNKNSFGTRGNNSIMNNNGNNYNTNNLTSKSPKAKRDMGAADGVMVQGGSLKTWSFNTPYIERVNVSLKTEGRPMNADIDLWHGPDNTPQKIAVYVEDGKTRPFNAVIETPRGQNAIAIRNTASLEYPLKASVETDKDGFVTDRPLDSSNMQIIQGGAVKSYTFAASVGSIAVLMKTDGRPLNARIELLQGPNNNKQVIDLYTEDGELRPFYSIIQTPGSGNVVRIVNTASMEYPLTCSVEPYEVETYDYDQSIKVDGFPFFN